MEQHISASAVSGRVDVPSSKSYAQRAIAACLLTPGTSTLRSVHLCDDTQRSLEIISHLGAKIISSEDNTYIIKGQFNNSVREINVGESGLASRMFTPILGLQNRELCVRGEGTLLARPMDMMIYPLSKLGVSVRSTNGCLPLYIKGPIKGGDIVIDNPISSQFLTGLLMALPLAQSDTTILVNRPVSIPYIDITIDLLDKFGIEVNHNNFSEFFVPGGQRYQPVDYVIEGDWSAAAMMLVAGAVAGEVTVYNLNTLSRQADIAILDALTKAGAMIELLNDTVSVKKPEELKGFDFDATHCPDLFPALVALASNCTGTTVIKGVHRLMHKESDRAVTICSEFSKLGIDVQLQDNCMLIRGGEIIGNIVDAHSDHRIAMACAVAGLNCSGVTVVQGAECVSKSYPDFWDDLRCIASEK